MLDIEVRFLLLALLIFLLVLKDRMSSGTPKFQ